MNDHPDNHQDDHSRAGFTVYLLQRLIMAVIVIAAVLYGTSVGIDYLQNSNMIPELAAEDPSAGGIEPADDAAHPVADTSVSTLHPAISEIQLQSDPAVEATAAETPETPAAETPSASKPDVDDKVVPREPAAQPPAQAPEPSAPHATDRSPAHSPEQAVAPRLRPAGVSFVEALIKPLDHELNHRFWGWRPNDILDVTDNINYLQLGVLEVTRRTVVQLADRISRTGYNDSFDRNLENAMNWLMIKATAYWFPAPETKYKESLAELQSYRTNLINNEAFFYTRSDNLIPLLAAFEDLMGSCDQNLVKTKESDGSNVGFTRADDYFYYAKGVATAMGTILEAVSLDFAPVLSNRNGAELLHHAIASCRLAASLDPWLITDGDLDGILANHRAHMAAPISHARFYLGQLIKTLST